MRLFHAVLSLPVIAASAVAIQATACDTTQAPRGGDALFDAGPEPIPCPDASCGPVVPDANWPALYKSIFGPTGIGQCGSASRTNVAGTATTSCHQSAGDNGAVASGFICGTTEESCFQGITNPSASFIGQQVVVACGEPCSYLPQVLRHGDGDGGIIGIMPFYPENAIVGPPGMDNVSAWIAAGAPRN
jgi:hypothetical protein